MLKYQVVVIGGGATGSGVLRDLALRGVKVALVDKGDLCSGTSARFHGLLHSGGRYAVNDLDAARECITENLILKKVAWHCVEDCGGYFLQMEGDDDRYVQKWVEACQAAGIEAVETDRDAVLREEPCLRKSLQRAFRVPDAAIDGFRLVYSNARSATRHGAGMYPYTAVKEIFRTGSRVTGLEVENILTGERSRMECEIVVNAGGAFAGSIANLAGVDLTMLPNRGAMIVFNHRIANKVLNRLRPPSDADIFVPHNTTMILGTTSVDVVKPDDYRPSREELDRLMTLGGEMVRDLGDYRPLRAYAGVRPLYSPGTSGAKGRAATRNFVLIDHGREDGLEGFVTITGGKFTIYRLMSEKTADLVTKKIGCYVPGSTSREKLVEPDKMATERVRKTFVSGFGELTVTRSASNLDEVKAELARNPLSKDILCECEGVSMAEVMASARHLPLQSLGEVRRRTRMGTGTCQGVFCGVRTTGLLVEEGFLGPDKFGPFLAEFLEKRWRGQQAVLHGQQLAEAELALGVYSSLLCLERIQYGAFNNEG
ncbi:MAG TPA: anaerobic glycerol-3-phosphate dehydrogenase subunit GlpA [Spirochaetia bacterium]|nr:anaerobic glycerol-3-phosphate dehydrogenase subunit GlpA [Spirochaetia bacterium]